MSISELPCSKLSGRHTSSSSTVLLSSPSPKSKPSSLSISSSFTGTSFSSSFKLNYGQILVHLKAEWEETKDTEIFDIEKTGKPSQEELPEPEIMRMPSSTRRKRQESPSPERLYERVVTPTKNVDQSSPVRIRTPRKDTPKKKIPRLQCRNAGCRVYLTNKGSRDKHESRVCKFRNVESEVSMETEYPVPSHDDLHLDPKQCRVCMQLYSNDRARKKHEMEQHRIFEQHGRTFSPVSFPSSPVQILFLVLSLVLLLSQVQDSSLPRDPLKGGEHCHPLQPQLSQRALLHLHWDPLT